jgi:hypothetical protein
MLRQNTSGLIALTVVIQLCSLDTEVEVLVKSVLRLSRVTEGNFVECDNGRGQAKYVFEVEMQNLRLLDRFDETGGLHLVDDLVRKKVGKD